MIGIASRATNEVNIPSRKVTRAEIMRMFKTHLTTLTSQLKSPAVQGDVSLTCDAWQAGNTDGYFAATVNRRRDGGDREGRRRASRGARGGGGELALLPNSGWISLLGGRLLLSLVRHVVVRLIPVNGKACYLDRPA